MFYQIKTFFDFFYETSYFFLAFKGRLTFIVDIFALILTLSDLDLYNHLLFSV